MRHFANLVACVAVLLSLVACDAPTPLVATPAITATPSEPLKENTSERQSVGPTPTATTVTTATPLAVSSPTAPAATASPTDSSPTPPAPIEVTVEMLDQQWGQAEDVAIVGNIAYVAIGPRLVALDVTDPAAPTLLSRSAILPGTATAVVVDGDVAYVAAGSAIVALDVTDPAASLTVLNQVDVGSVITQLELMDDTLVAGLSIPAPTPAEDDSGRIVTLDASTPDRLRTLDSVELPWPVHALALNDNYLFVANPAAADFYVLDAANPAQLPDAVAVSGMALTYSLGAGGGVSDLHAWDVDDPLQPQPLWNVQAPPDPDFGLGIVQGFILRDRHAFLTAVGYDGQTTALISLDLPQSVATGITAGRLAIMDDHVFFARGDLLIYALAEAASAVEVGRYGWPLVNDVALRGNTGIVAAGDRLLTLNLPDLIMVGEYVGQTHCAPCYAAYQEVALADDIAYVSAADDGLRVIGLSDPTTPALLGSLDATTGFPGLRISAVAVGEFVYTGVAGECLDANLSAFDLKDPATPRREAEATAQGCVIALDAGDQRLYAAGNFADRPGGALSVFIEDTAGPQPAGSLAWPEPLGSVRAFGDLALVGTASGLEVVDVVDPTMPVVVASMPIPGGVHDIAVADSLVMVTTAGNEGKLIVIDLRRPSSPQTVGEANLPAGRMRLATTDAYVLAGNSTAGIVLLRVSEK